MVQFLQKQTRKNYIENPNKIPEEEIRLKIRNKRFLNETALNQYVKWNALSLIVQDVKVWKSKEWIEVNYFSILEKDSDEQAQLLGLLICFYSSWSLNSKIWA